VLRAALANRGDLRIPSFFESDAGGDRPEDFECDRGPDGDGENNLAQIWKAFAGNQRHPDGDASLREQGEAYPSVIGIGRRTQFSADPTSHNAGNRAQGDEASGDHAEFQPTMRLQGGAGKKEEQDHERPFDLLDLVKGAGVVFREIDDMARATLGSITIATMLKLVDRAALDRR